MAHDAAIALGQLMGVGRRQRRRALPGDVLQQLVESWRLNRTMHRFWAGLFMGKTGMEIEHGKTIEKSHQPKKTWKKPQLFAHFYKFDGTYMGKQL